MGNCKNLHHHFEVVQVYGDLALATTQSFGCEGDEVTPQGSAPMPNREMFVRSRRVANGNSRATCSPTTQHQQSSLQFQCAHLSHQQQLQCYLHHLLAKAIEDLEKKIKDRGEIHQTRMSQMYREANLIDLCIEDSSYQSLRPQERRYSQK